MTAHQRRNAYLMLLPAVVCFVVFIAYPLLNTVRWSFFDASLTNPVRRFVGVGNYLELFRDPVFWISLRNNIIILVGSVIFQVGIGLLLAAVFDRSVRRGSTFFRTLIFTPVVMSSVAVGLVWQMLLNPQLGVINPLLKSVGIPPPSLGWLGDPTLAIYGVLLVACWQYTGYMMVLLLAGIQSVPGELYEAAILDGASERQSFWYITLPGIRNVLITATLITMIGAFKVFDLVYILTGGGPANASQVLGTYLYNQAFTQARMGYACAIAVVLLLFAMSLSVIQLRLGRSEAKPS
jgi:raffinose/stachyose/melibiose transport system permease protein